MNREQIEDAEQLIQDLYVLLDLKDEEINDLKNENKALKGQYALLLRDYKIADVG